MISINNSTELIITDARIDRRVMNQELLSGTWKIRTVPSTTERQVRIFELIVSLKSSAVLAKKKKNAKVDKLVQCRCVSFYPYLNQSFLFHTHTSTTTFIMTFTMTRLYFLL